MFESVLAVVQAILLAVVAACVCVGGGGLTPTCGVVQMFREERHFRTVVDGARHLVAALERRSSRLPLFVLWNNMDGPANRDADSQEALTCAARPRRACRGVWRVTWRAQGAGGLPSRARRRDGGPRERRDHVR